MITKAHPHGRKPWRVGRRRRTVGVLALTTAVLLSAVSFGQVGGSPAAAVSSDPTLPDQIPTGNKIPDWVYVISPLHPAEVFARGIQPAGTDANIVRHVFGNVHTGFVPAVSTVEAFAPAAPSLATQAYDTRVSDLWVYQVRPTTAVYDLSYSLSVMSASAQGRPENRELASQARAIITDSEWAVLGSIGPAQIAGASRLRVADLLTAPSTWTVASQLRNRTENSDNYQPAATAANVHLITNPDFTGINAPDLAASIVAAQGGACSAPQSSRSTTPVPCAAGSFTPYMSPDWDTRGLTPSFVSQVTPTLTAGQTDLAVVRMTNNTSTVSSDGVTFALTAPSETTFASSCVEYINSADSKGGTLCGTLGNQGTTLSVKADGFRFPGNSGSTAGWYNLGARLKANNAIRNSSGEQCGTVMFTAGPAIRTGVSTNALCYQLAVADPRFNAETIPALKPGSSGLSMAKMYNTTSVPTPNGAQFTMTAPPGTTFAEACARYANNLDAKGGCLSGQLNNAKTTLTVSSNAFTMPPRTSQGDGWYTLGAQLKADDANSQPAGQKCGRLDFTGGSAVRVGAGSPSLCVDLRVVDPTFATEAVPTLNAGGQGLAMLRMTNNLGEQTPSPNGAQFTLTAPEGTTFTQACAQFANSLDVKGGCLPGQLNDTKTVLTVSSNAFQFPGGALGWYSLGADLKAASPLAFAGLKCGTVKFTGGSAVRVGAASTSSFCFTAASPK